MDPSFLQDEVCEARGVVGGYVAAVSYLACLLGWLVSFLAALLAWLVGRFVGWLVGWLVWLA